MQHELQKFARSILPVTQQNHFELLETTSRVLGFKQKKRATAIRLLEKNQSDCTEPNKNFQRHILFIDSQYTSNEDIECRADKTRSNRLASQKII